MCLFVLRRLNSVTFRSFLYFIDTNYKPVSEEETSSSRSFRAK